MRRRDRGLDRPIKPIYPNYVWAYDFIEDSCLNGRKFHSRLRDEYLNMELFYGLRDAKVKIKNYRRYYNVERRYGSLSYVPPLEFKQ
ncbi:integrase core domain-containing protein [Candidatus Pacearchaeota archaeon]|nr:integrase core domain-containing protein [Candidatus Pacearchaeota archaeon]